MSDDITTKRHYYNGVPTTDLRPGATILLGGHTYRVTAMHPKFGTPRCRVLYLHGLSAFADNSRRYDSMHESYVPVVVPEVFCEDAECYVVVEVRAGG